MSPSENCIEVSVMDYLLSVPISMLPLLYFTLHQPTFSMLTLTFLVILFTDYLVYTS